MYTNFIKKTFIFALLAAVSTSQAFIYKGTIWKKKGSEQHLYCLSDMHVNRGRDERIALRDLGQRKALMSMLSQCNNATTKVIVEDPRAASEEANLKLQGATNILLANLVIDCQSKSLDVCNVECRARRIFAQHIYFVTQDLRKQIVPLKSDIEWSLKDNNANAAMSMYFELEYLEKILDDTRKRDVLIVDILKEFEHAIEQIKGCRDSELLNRYYADTIEHITQNGQSMLKKLRGVQDYFSHFIAEQIPKDFQDLSVLSCASFAPELLDMNALHEIYHAQDKKKIFVIMGGGHVVNMEQVLPKMGYELVCTSGRDYDAFMHDLFGENLAKIWGQKLDVGALMAESAQLVKQQNEQLPSMKPVEDSFFGRCLQHGSDQEPEDRHAPGDKSEEVDEKEEGKKGSDSEELSFMIHQSEIEKLFLRDRAKKN